MMAKAQLSNGLILNVDDSLSDEQIDALVAEHVTSVSQERLILEMRLLRKAMQQNTQSLIEAITAARITTLEKDGEGKPAKSITKVVPSIFKE
jgi:hypothetical protein